MLNPLSTYESLNSYDSTPHVLSQQPRSWSMRGEVHPTYQRGTPRVRPLLGLRQLGFRFWAVYGGWIWAFDGLYEYGVLGQF